MGKYLRQYLAHEFALRLKVDSEKAKTHYAFFLGAGCSVTSKIPASASLVRDHWLPRLRAFEAPGATDLETWARSAIPGFDPKQPAASFGAVMARLFPTAEHRQHELERLCDGKFPRSGYATLAGLMALEGGGFNVVLTTNFDDMVADALYLFTKARPLVVHHESLAVFIRPTRSRPLVVKLHGDHRLSPMITAQDTASVKSEFNEPVRGLLNDRGLVFCGYGGNDKGIRDLMQSLPDNALPLGVYWVSGSEPRCELREWLERRDAIWVKMSGFDEFMLIIRDVFKLPHPDKKPIDQVFNQLYADVSALRKSIYAQPVATSDDAALKAAVLRPDPTFPDEWVAVFEAYRNERENPDEAEAIYCKAIEEYPASAALLGNYAIFLQNIRKKHDKAEKFYKRAIKAAPENADHLGNYAIFLENIRKDNDTAEEFYKRAIKAAPEQANNLGNYATFLQNIRKEHDKAEEIFRRALKAEPEHANNLGNYAIFLQNIRKEHDKAEEFYKRAIKAAPENADHLGNYATFLQNIRKEHDKAEEIFRRALKAEPEHANNLGNYAIFLQNIRKEHDKAEEFYKRAIKAAPENADHLGDYATFFHFIRKDYVRAEEFYKRALGIDPDIDFASGNYAGLMLGLGRHAEGWKLLRNVLSRSSLRETPGLAVECWFYAYAHGSTEQRTPALKELKKLLSRGERSPGWDLSLNIGRARQDDHPESAWLGKLAAVIFQGKDIAVMNGWEKWRDL